MFDRRRLQSTQDMYTDPLVVEMLVVTRPSTSRLVWEKLALKHRHGSVIVDGPGKISLPWGSASGPDCSSYQYAT